MGVRRKMGKFSRWMELNWTFLDQPQPNNGDGHFYNGEKLLVFWGGNLYSQEWIG